MGCGAEELTTIVIMDMENSGKEGHYIFVIGWKKFSWVVFHSVGMNSNKMMNFLMGELF